MYNGLYQVYCMNQKEESISIQWAKYNYFTFQVPKEVVIPGTQTPETPVTLSKDMMTNKPKDPDMHQGNTVTQLTLHAASMVMVGVCIDKTEETNTIMDPMRLIDTLEIGFQILEDHPDLVQDPTSMGTILDHNFNQIRLLVTGMCHFPLKDHS